MANEPSVAEKEVGATDIQRKAAEEANEKIGSMRGGPTLLSGEIGTPVLDQFEKTAKLEKESLHSKTIPELLSRRGFEEIVVPEASVLQREGKPLYLAFVDMDKLKAINDNYGHGVGDEVIQLLASTLRRGFSRASDINAIQSIASDEKNKNVARQNETGDEFLIAAPLASKEEIDVKLNDIKAEFEEAAKEVTHGTISPSFSFGIAQMGEELVGDYDRDKLEKGDIEVRLVDKVDPRLALDKALKVAEMRMYKNKISKNQGRYNV